MKNNNFSYFFSVPYFFRELWTREKQLQWKNVKKTFICSLHFESNCFRGRKLDFKNAIPITPTLPSPLQDHDYIPFTAASDHSHPTPEIPVNVDIPQTQPPTSQPTSTHWFKQT